MSSEPDQAVSLNPVAQDGHARERLRNAPTDVDGGGYGHIITLDDDDEEFAMVAYVNHGTDASELHEAFAAVFQQADDAISLSYANGGDRDR